jgi:plastocyanin
VKKAVLVAALLVAGSFVAGCQAAASTPATPPPGAIVVSASDSKFDQASVAAPAQQVFTLWFHNRESVPHNARLTDNTGTTIATTEVVSGPTGVAVDVPSLPAGGYALVCDVHPGMATTLLAD